MRRAQARWVAFIVTGLCVILAGCGGAATSQRPADAATTAPLPTATATPAPSPTVYFAGQATSSDGPTVNTVYALNSANGSVRWSKPFGSILEYVVAAGADVYVTDGFGSITALNPTNGSQLWQVKNAHGSAMQPVADTSAFYGGAIGGSTADGYVAAFSATDGKILWEHDLGDTPSSYNLTVAGGILYIGSWNTLTALRTTDGSVAWTVNMPTPSPQEASTPSIIGDTVYVEAGGSDFAFDKTSGSLRWSYTPPSLSSMGDSTVSGAGGLVYTGNGATLIALHGADGTVAWTSSPGGLFFDMSIYNNVIYTSAGNLVALNATSGATMWSVTLSGGYGYAPILSNGALFESRSIGASQQPAGYIYALNPANGSVLWEFSHPNEAYTNVVVM